MRLPVAPPRLRHSLTFLLTPRAPGTLLAQLNNQFPLSYTHLVIIISQVVLVATALECGVLTGLALHMPGFEGYGRVVPRLILLFILPIVYEGLLDIKQHVANPFMNDGARPVPKVGARGLWG